MSRGRDISSDATREFIRDHVPVWNKQCVRCSTVYNKFHRLCPECQYGEWLLEGEVVDVEESRLRGRKQKGRYRPREETIEKVKAEIQQGWIRDKDPRASQGPIQWEPPGSRIKQRDDDHDRF